MEYIGEDIITPAVIDRILRESRPGKIKSGSALYYQIVQSALDDGEGALLRAVKGGLNLRAMFQPDQEMNKDRVERIISDYGRKAGITGVRVSPHTFRHTAAVSFLRNGGDAFSLQRLLGHSSLDMTRHYCQLADVDVKRAHITASAVDNLELRPARSAGPARRQRK